MPSTEAQLKRIQWRCRRGTRELDALLGSWAKVLRIEVVHFDSPFLLAMLPPGAFIGLGLLLALKYLIDERMKARTAKALLAEPTLGQGQTEKA